MAVYVEAVRSPFARQPNGLRAVTHTKERGRLIAQLIDLHQRSQDCARKEGNASHDIMLHRETRGASQGERLLFPHRGRQSVRDKETRKAHMHTGSYSYPCEDIGLISTRRVKSNNNIKLNLK